MSNLVQLEALVKTNRDLPPPAVRRALREAAGVSLEELADAIGVTRQAVWLWETGRRRPRPEYRRNYVHALQVLGSTGEAAV